MFRYEYDRVAFRYLTRIHKIQHDKMNRVMRTHEHAGMGYQSDLAF